MRKVLVANRGEIAVRVIRACRDAGLRSVGVYADGDLNAPHAQLADEAYALSGVTAQQTYLSVGKLIEVARRSGADAVHPGYGFLSENADFAAAVLDAGLTWIGPPPQAIRLLGDKVSARALAREVAAPLAPGTDGAVHDPTDVVEFAEAHGLPVAIKAAHGGGGRGLKVAGSLAEIPELFASAQREAIAAFGRGECFAERYLSRPRHVETQCLADGDGTVVVLSTRDCTLQRRHQKLLEEAPAPFLSTTQRRTLYEASKAILRAAGYVGAGTCEFLIGADGLVSFLEVNTRLQVEHPVTEQVTGVDLVLEMFRIADGQPLGYDDPVARGHALEFRINGEDPAAGFVPVPGKVVEWHEPAGPGVRVDAGVTVGTDVPPHFDSLLAKLIVTGADRSQALARARRALGEFRIAGIPTTLDFHRAVLADPAFTAVDGTGFTVHTDWIDTEYRHPGGPAERAPAGETDAVQLREAVTVEVNGRRVQIRLPAGLTSAADHPVALRSAARKPRPSARGAGRQADSAALTAPMQGTVVTVAVSDGQRVGAGEVIAVLEAMKMEQPIGAHRAGTVSRIAVAVGDTVAHGAHLCDIEP